MPSVRILIADDSRVARMVVRRSLFRVDAEFIEAPSGVATLKAIRAHHPHLVLLDISMPGLDGLMVLRRVRSDPEFRNTHIVILSVEGGKSCRQIAERLGIDGYFTKPQDFRAMIAHVEAFAATIMAAAAS